MQVNIIIFGQLRDVLGEKLELDNVNDTVGLKAVLHEKYPGMSGANYMVAVDKKVITENTTLTENCTIAILSPFSGG
jgi:sulfur-carrier protein